MVEVGRETLLDRVIEACASTASIERFVVVGPPRVTARDVRFLREDPPGGGPSAAIAAGLAGCSSPWVGVFAADLPFLTAEAVHSLWTACAEAGPDHDGAVSLDAGGREQWLAAVYRRDALLSKIAEHGPEGVRGLALRKLVGGLRLVRVAQPGHAVFDCDTWEDVDAARRIFTGAPYDAFECDPIERGLDRTLTDRAPLDRGRG